MRIKEANHDEHKFRPLLPLNNCYMMHHFLTIMICFALTSNSSKWKDRGCEESAEGFPLKLGSLGKKVLIKITKSFVQFSFFG